MLQSGQKRTRFDQISNEHAFKSFKHLRKTGHTHHPVDDAKGNAEALLAMKAKYGLKIRLE